MFDRMDVRCTCVQSRRELLQRKRSQTVSITSLNAVGDLMTGLRFRISRFLDCFEMLDYCLPLRTKTNGSVTTTPCDTPFKFTLPSNSRLQYIAAYRRETAGMFDSLGFRLLASHKHYSIVREWTQCMWKVEAFSSYPVSISPRSQSTGLANTPHRVSLPSIRKDQRKRVPIKDDISSQHEGACRIRRCCGRDRLRAFPWSKRGVFAPRTG